MAWNISYTFQLLAAIFTIFVYVFILMKVKLFSMSELIPVTYVIKMMLIPGLLFQVISTHKLNWETWKAFFPIAIPQFVTHLVVFLVCYFLKTKNFKKTYLIGLASFAFQEYAILIYAFVQHTAGTDYTIASVYGLLLDVFLYRPILNFLLYKIDKEIHEKKEIINQSDPNKPKATKKDESTDSLNKANKDDKKDGVELEDIHDPENIKDKTPIDGAGNPDITPEIKEEEHIAAPPSEEEDESESNIPCLWKTLLFSWVNSSTIAIIAGFIYAATGSELLDYFQDFTGDLRNASAGATMFIMAAIVTTSLPLFKVWSPLIPLSLAFRYIILPLIVGGLCKAFSVEKLMTKVCVILACAPPSLVGYTSLDDSKEMDVPKAIFNWSVILYVPFALCWAAITVKTNLFM